MLIPLLLRLNDSQIKVADGVVAEVADSIDYGRGVLEQIGSGRLTVDQEALLSDLHIDPIDGDVQSCGQLCGAQRSGLVGPSVALCRYPDPGAEPDPLHGDRQDLFGAIGRAVPLLGEDGGNLIIRHAGYCEIEQTRTHFFTARELGDGVDLHLDLKFRDRAASPDNSGHSNIVLAAIENDFFDQTPQQRLAMRVRRGVVRPNLRQATGKGDDLAVEGFAQRHLHDGLGRSLPGKGFFGSANLAQRRFPSTLEFAGDKTIVRIDAVELALGQRCSIALALKLTFRAAAQGLFDLLLRPAARDSASISAGASAAKNASATAASTREARMCWQAGKPVWERR